MPDLEELAADLGGPKIDAPAPEVSRETSPSAPAEPVRDEHGRFTAKPADPVAPQPVEAPVPAAVVPQPEAKTTVDGIPLSVALEWKSELKEAKKRLAELEQTKQEQPPVPSMFEDPEAYQKHIALEIQKAAIFERVNFSEIVARRAVGNEAVDKALAWGNEKLSGPERDFFWHQQIAQSDPIDWLVKQYQQDEWLKSVGSDQASRDAWAMKRAAELQAAIPASPSPQPPTNGAAHPQQVSQQPLPQRSLAAAPTAGNHATSVPLGLQASLDAAFPR